MNYIYFIDGVSHWPNVNYSKRDKNSDLLKDLPITE